MGWTDSPAGSASLRLARSPDSALVLDRPTVLILERLIDRRTLQVIIRAVGHHYPSAASHCKLQPAVITETHCVTAAEPDEPVGSARRLGSRGRDVTSAELSPGMTFLSV